MLVWCWLAACCTPFGAAIAGGFERRGILEQIRLSRQYVPWYRRMAQKCDEPIIDDQVSPLNIQHSLQLFKRLDKTLEDDLTADLNIVIDRNWGWRYAGLRDKLSIIPKVLLLEWADMLLKLLQQELSDKVRAALDFDFTHQDANSLESQKSRSTDDTPSSSHSNPDEDDYFQLIIHEIASAAAFNLKTESPLKLIKSVQLVYAFATRAYDAIKAVSYNSNASFRADFSTYIEETQDSHTFDTDLLAFREEMSSLGSISDDNSIQHLIIDRLRSEKKDIEQQLWHAQQQISLLTSAKANLEQDRVDVIEEITQYTMVADTSPLLPAVQSLTSTLCNLKSEHNTLMKQADTILDELEVANTTNQDLSSQLNASVVGLKLEHLKGGMMQQKLETLQEANEKLARENLEILNVKSQLETKLSLSVGEVKNISEEKSQLQSSLEDSRVQAQELRKMLTEAENQSKQVEEYIQLLSHKEKEAEGLMILVEELRASQKKLKSSQQARPVVYYTSSSATSRTCKTKKAQEPSQMIIAVPRTVYTEQDVQRLVLAERAMIPERCRVIDTANLALFGSSLTLFAAGSGLIGYWYCMLRPALAII